MKCFDVKGEHMWDGKENPVRFQWRDVVCEVDDDDDDDEEMAIMSWDKAGWWWLIDW